MAARTCNVCDSNISIDLISFPEETHIAHRKNLEYNDNKEIEEINTILE